MKTHSYCLVVVGLLIGMLTALIEVLGLPKLAPENLYVPPLMQGLEEPPRNVFKSIKKAPPPKPQPKEKKPPVRLYWAQAKALSTREIHCLALNIYHEARGEKHSGKVGVAQVTLNRVDASFRKKTNVCAVVYDSAQFSWTLSSSKRYTLPKGDAWESSMQIAQDVANGLRVYGLEDSLYYHATWITPPSWAKQMLYRKSIGQHIFFSPSF